MHVHVPTLRSVPASLGSLGLSLLLAAGCEAPPPELGDGGGSDDTGPMGGTDAGDSEDGSDGSADETGDGGTAPEPGDGCPDELFVAPAPHPANAAYPDPELDAYCTEDELVVTSNGIPGYEFTPTTPNDLQGQSHEWRVPLQPTEAGAQATIPLLGPVAFSVNGMPIFGPNEAAMPDPYGDPIYNGLMDFCLGHTAMGGTYHYHGLLVECVVGEVGPDEPSPIIGFAFDGYPIYGPVGCLDEACEERVTFVSGWEQTGDPSTYAWDNHAYVGGDDPTVLDQCNGRVGPDGTYRYHATGSFPYVIGCYHGEAVVGMP